MLHLLHPALVHFSVAFLVTGGLCEAWGIFFGAGGAERLGRILVLLGALSLVPTVVTGYVAANSVELPADAGPVLDVHERNALVLVVIFSVLFLWKGWFGGTLPAEHRGAYAVAVLVAVAFTIYNALLGGELVYVHGVGVAPH